MTTAIILIQDAKVTRVIDGDTLEVSVEFGELPLHHARIRLLDCWAPESHKPGGPEATEHLRELCLHEMVDIRLPYQPGEGLLQVLSFDRLLGRVYLKDGTDLSELQVAAGHATKDKPR